MPSIVGLTLIVLLVLVAATWWTLERNKQSQVRYNGKTLSDWFFGQRRGFFYESRNNSDDQAFKAAGTNGFAFLLSMLNERGNSGFYFKFYQKMPPPTQGLFQYPISGDDIQMTALMHFNKMPNIPDTIPEELLARLARRVPDLSNPRVRLRGLYTLDQLTRYEREPLLWLCRHLLDDPHFGIRLDAALKLAELRIKEIRTIPILLAALEDKEKLMSTRSISWYTFGQPPGGSGTGGPGAIPGQTAAGFEKMHRDRVVRALESLEPQLDEHQKNLVERFKIKAQVD